MQKLTRKEVFEEFQNKNKKEKRYVTKDRIYNEYTFEDKKQFEDFVHYIKIRLKWVKITKINKRKKFLRIDNITLKSVHKIYSYIKNYLITKFEFAGEHFYMDSKGNITVKSTLKV